MYGVAEQHQRHRLIVVIQPFQLKVSCASIILNLFDNAVIEQIYCSMKSVQGCTLFMLQRSRCVVSKTSSSTQQTGIYSERGAAKQKSDAFVMPLRHLYLPA